MAALKEDWSLLGQPVALVTTLAGPHCGGRESRTGHEGCGGRWGVTCVIPISTLRRLSENRELF